MAMKYLVIGPWSHGHIKNIMLSTTIQTVCSKLDRVIEWIDSVNNSTGLPVLVQLDECQNYGIDESGTAEVESQNWFPAIKRLQSETNIILLALSGYPLREDGLCLPGFEPLGIDNQKRQRWVKGKVLEELNDKQLRVERKLIKYIEQSFTMAPRGGADFIVGMERGFSSNALCALHHRPISHKITTKEDGKVVLNNQSLADVDETTARRSLGKYVWDDKVINACVVEFVRLLTEKRRAEASLKGLVFAMMDVADRGEPSRGEPDAHPNKIKASLEMLAPALKVRIVTINTVESLSDALLDFNTDEFDVLILKNGGRVGFDCPRAKVLLDLSTVRTECMVAQTWLRVSTPYHGIPGEIITPSDIVACKLYAKIVKHNGGDRLSRSLNSEIIKEEEIIIEKIDRFMSVGEQEPMNVTSHDLQNTPYEDWQLVDIYLAAYPNSNSYLHQQPMPARVEYVKLQMQNHGWSPPPNAVPTKPAPLKRRFADAHQYSKPITKAWYKAAHKKAGIRRHADLNGDAEKTKQWNIYHKQIGITAKLHVGEPGDLKLGEIQNLDKLEAMLVFLEGLG